MLYYFSHIIILLNSMGLNINLWMHGGFSDVPMGGVIISGVMILTAEIREGTGKLNKFLVRRNLGDIIDLKVFPEKGRIINLVSNSRWHAW